MQRGRANEVSEEVFGGGGMNLAAVDDIFDRFKGMTKFYDEFNKFVKKLPEDSLERKMLEGKALTREEEL